MSNRTSFTGLLPIAALAAMLLGGCQKRVDLGPVADAPSAKAIRDSFASKKTAGGEKTAAKPTGTGWATLRGQFVYDGTPPEMPPYSVTKEAEVCAPGGKAPVQEMLAVDSGTKGIKNVVVFLRDASRVHESAAPKKDTIVFDQKECKFLSHVAAVT